MYYIYILQSQKDLRTYTGYTENLEKRVFQHNKGEVEATKNRRPLKLIYLEKFITMDEAKSREKYWKSGAGSKKPKKII